MRETNEIFKGIITRVVNNPDAAGNPEYTMYAKVFSEAEATGVGSEFVVRQMSNIPTKPVGTKAVAMPVQGQRLLLFRSPMQHIAYIVGYLEDTSVSIPIYERPLEAGEFKIITPGIRPTEVSIKPNEIKLDSGGYSNLTISQRTSSISAQSKKYLRLFHGGYEENQWIKDTGITPSVSVWVKQKESNAASDKFNIETEEPRTPLPGVLPNYVDKVIERKGAILDYSNGGALLNHVYQLETRQDVGQTGTKNTFSVLKLGHQDKMAGNLPNRQGNIIDWSTKRVNSATSATVTQYLAGISPNGEIFRSQYADGVVISSIPGVDPAAKDQGYDLLDITSDNSANVLSFWQSESINNGQDGYFYRKGHTKTGFLHNYEESSEDSFIKRQSSRKDGTKNEFLEEMKQNSYELKLETAKTVYFIKMTENSIEIKMSPDNDNKKTSYAILTDTKAEIKFGTDSVVTLTDEVCDIITKSKLNLNTTDTTITSSGNIAINTSGNTAIDTKGGTDIISSGAMTINTSAVMDVISSKGMNIHSDASITIDSPDVKVTGAKAALAGTVTPTGSGALCGLPMCLFTGAPHVGPESFNNYESFNN